ncbi:MAG: hypothetical protein WCL27_07210 [Betaproteobacteria bacterium]
MSVQENKLCAWKSTTEAKPNIGGQPNHAQRKKAELFNKNSVNHDFEGFPRQQQHRTIQQSMQSFSLASGRSTTDAYSQGHTIYEST